MQAFSREAKSRSRRREAIGRRKKLAHRRARSQIQTEEFEERLTEAQEEISRLADAPDEFLLQRRGLAQKIEEAETAKKAAATPAPLRRQSRPKPTARRAGRWKP